MTNQNSKPTSSNNKPATSKPNNNPKPQQQGQNTSNKPQSYPLRRDNQNLTTK